MEEKQQKAGLGRYVSASAPFFLGLALALVIGWWAFPSLLFSQKEQPVAFRHATHVEGQSMECADCHYLREDGSFSGIPATEACASCHAAPLGESAAEAEYIEKFVEPGKEVPWLVHQKQPDNVFFSHAAHSRANCQNLGCHPEWEDDFELCTTCHPSVADLDKPIPYKENRLTGYSKSTMKMWECERCHANPTHLSMSNANNACHTCHK